MAVCSGRPGRRSDGASFTVETFARYLMHDPIHHLHDVTGIRPAELASSSDRARGARGAADEFPALASFNR